MIFKWLPETLNKSLDANSGVLTAICRHFLTNTKEMEEEEELAMEEAIDDEDVVDRAPRSSKINRDILRREVKLAHRDAISHSNRFSDSPHNYQIQRISNNRDIAVSDAPCDPRYLPQ
eukprot:CAMPEP_0194138366 /NCGR_PEP_ID=MMETSP0152-20130528/8170_1 /TAXON_ID=1049557 /ORGANISM="Thalassiothrix antarctica, Strain L6-D1" /LENGTH=117 /DNA_ID=CAMNT_0038835795 /DNA_START=61 /DNA_END=414 /DNA_ORIENTATION=+